MPRICMWKNVIIYMYWFDHNPPHIHVEYAGTMSMMSIEAAQILEGQLPRRIERQVRAWIERRRPELLANWQHAQRGEPLVWIEP